MNFTKHNACDVQHRCRRRNQGNAETADIVVRK